MWTVGNYWKVDAGSFFEDMPVLTCLLFISSWGLTYFGYACRFPYGFYSDGRDGTGRMGRTDGRKTVCSFIEERFALPPPPPSKYPPICP